MSYRRPTDTPSPEVLVPQFETAIRSLIRRFRNHPYAFHTETDMHCYLYHRLYAGGLVNGLYRTIEGRDTILLHKEYPTVARYHRDDDGRLMESTQGRRRGAYDISIWDPRFIGQQEHRKQKILCAAELALNECGLLNPHTLNDATKLSGPTNEIRYGYLLFSCVTGKKSMSATRQRSGKILKTLLSAFGWLSYMWMNFPNPNHNILVCGVHLKFVLGNWTAKIHW